MSDDLLRDLATKVDRLVEQQAETRTELAGFRREYEDGRRAAREIARGNAAHQASTEDHLVRVDRRTEKLDGQMFRVEKQTTETNCRVTELEKKAIEQEAIARSRSWRFGAWIAVVCSVTSGSILALVALLLR